MPETIDLDLILGKPPAENTSRSVADVQENASLMTLPRNNETGVNEKKQAYASKAAVIVNRKTSQAHSNCMLETLIKD